MNNRFLSFVILFFFTISLLAQNPIFQSNFGFDIEIVNIINNNNRDDINGSDISPYDWTTTLTENAKFGDFDNFYIQYVNGDYSERKASIEDPIFSGSLKNVLKFDIISPNNGGSNGRIQANFSNNKHGLIGTGFKTFHYSVKLFLPSYFNNYLNDSSYNSNFFTLAEFFNDIGYNAVYPNDFPFRMTISLRKALDENNINGFVLTVEGQQQFLNEETGNWNGNWTDSGATLWNKSTRHIPVGEWITLKVLIKEGDANNGAFKLTVLDASDETITSFDVGNYTHHPQSTNINGITHIQPMKLYTSANTVNKFNCGDINCPTNILNPQPYNPIVGEGIEVYWDDFIIYNDSELREKLIKLVEDDCSNGIDANDMTLSVPNIVTANSDNSNWQYHFRFKNITDTNNADILIVSNQPTIDLMDYLDEPFIGSHEYRLYVKVKNHPYFKYYGIGVDNYCTIIYPSFSGGRNTVNNKLEVNSEMSIYPNPVKDILNINLGYETKANSFEIFNIHGLLLNYKENIVGTNFEVSISNLSKGVYFIRVTDENGSQKTRKFIKD
ncbi:T9SS type A sorting domain-containing protein [uncultured Winogradskyella sp.]|uniref:T9SS type A sorting domain-containing protein n=1 Tax=uncultured Winogradskyella sp. TaxID=395353 RepID=UPI0026094A3E|nr:T9SS type A sorting domain-containing protein [uncultured Winogradskyella sp.]